MTQTGKPRPMIPNQAKMEGLIKFDKYEINKINAKGILTTYTAFCKNDRPFTNITFYRI